EYERHGPSTRQSDPKRELQQKGISKVTYNIIFHSPIIFTRLNTMYTFLKHFEQHFEHTSRLCEPNCGYLPLCLYTSAVNDHFFRNVWIPVSVKVHYQQNAVQLQHFLPMFRYSIQNS